MRALIVLGLCVLALRLVGQAALPVGFSDALVVGGFSDPTGLAFASDDRIFVGERITGLIHVVAPSGAAAIIGFVPDLDTTTGSRGVLGLAVDVQWPTRPYVYVHYTRIGVGLAVSRFTIDGAVGDPNSTTLSLGDRYDLLFTTDVHDGHDGGCLRFGLDGYLYASIGDDVSEATAQLPISGLGQIMRLDVSSLPPGPGTTPPLAILAASGNPYPSGSGYEVLTWAFGFRNPFRFDVDRLNGELFVADVGGGLWEEIDRIAAGGANCGWPTYEGSVLTSTPYPPLPSAIPPIVAIGHAEGWNAATAVVRYRNPTSAAPLSFGSAFEGDVFVADFGSGELRRYVETPSGFVIGSSPGQPSPTAFGLGFSGIVDLQVGPDGALYYLSLYDGTLRRIEGSGAGSLGSIEIVSGNHQSGVAGRALSSPFIVRARSPQGVPMAGVNIQFTVTQGAGSFDSSVAVTDLAGLAAATFSLDLDDVHDPVVVASSPGLIAASIDVSWRGVQAFYFPSAGVLASRVAIDTPFETVLIGADLPATVPFSVSAFGEIWTSILNPAPTFFFALATTDQEGDIAQPLANIPPLAGVSLTIQAYAVDSSLLPSTDALFISNPVIVDFSPSNETAVLELVSGADQVGEQGMPLDEAWRYRVTTLTGIPLKGIPISLAAAQGAGQLDQSQLVTDADGYAEATLTLDSVVDIDPVFVASTPISAPVLASAVWRGIATKLFLNPTSLVVDVRVRDVGTTVYLGWDLPGPTPWYVSQWGAIWTSIATPGPYFGFMVATTDAASAASFLPPLQASGSSWVYQGYAHDLSLPLESGVLVTEPRFITFP